MEKKSEVPQASGRFIALEVGSHDAMLPHRAVRDRRIRKDEATADREPRRTFGRAFHYD